MLTPCMSTTKRRGLSSTKYLNGTAALASKVMRVYKSEGQIRAAVIWALLAKASGVTDAKAPALKVCNTPRRVIKGMGLTSFEQVLYGG